MAIFAASSRGARPLPETTRPPQATSARKVQKLSAFGMRMRFPTSAGCGVLGLLCGLDNDKPEFVALLSLSPASCAKPKRSASAPSTSKTKDFKSSKTSAKFPSNSAPKLPNSNYFTYTSSAPRSPVPKSPSPYSRNQKNRFASVYRPLRSKGWEVELGIIY